ncbi:MAG: hypothetical protein NC344_00250 [Bacteroidales bacterium]|nr:hypothetical protein [Bacteroidales bacterium]MCM1146268.1 hypothetical protein [Bacteroidales bacterium]MCM1205294.1 hypothetical protein [Bacillota bacterium]MCM1509619.1 hypothetical protein [Clostridium sp.]
MKKIFTLIASALMTLGANAQVVVEPIEHTFYTEVTENTYAVTTTLEAVTSVWGEANLTWGMGVRLPADYVLVDNEKMTMKTAVESTPIYFSGNKCGDMQKDFPEYKGYMNLGCSFPQNNWKGNEPETIEEIGALYKNHHGIFAVVPKVDGTLSFGVYAGDNSRSIGIIDFSTEEEILDGKPSSFVAYNNFRNDGVELDQDGNVTVKNAPAYVKGEVKAGRTYLLVGGDGKNLTMHQVKFVPGTGTGIQNVEAAENAKVAPVKVIKNGQIMIGDFNIAGQRVK